MLNSLSLAVVKPSCPVKVPLKEEQSQWVSTLEV